MNSGGAAQNNRIFFYNRLKLYSKITDLEAATFPKASPLIEKCDIVAFFFILKKRILRY